MEYKEYFSRSNAVWNYDLLKEPNGIMSPPKCRASFRTTISDGGLPLCVKDGSDPLDEARINAIDEFRSNGVDCDLDEIDQYQQGIRNVRSLPDGENNSALACYVALRKTRRKKKIVLCVFCRNNGELPTLYTSHVLKGDDGKVQCPVLRKYTCPLCGSNGDTAHTVKYCPKNDGSASPGCLILVNSTRDSTGQLKARWPFSTVHNYK